MPSPFPGMDPFLERPAVFPDLHESLVMYLRETLQARLPEPYYAGVGTRVWVEVSHRFIEPDVRIHRGSDEPDTGEREEVGSVAVMTEIRTKPVVVTVPHDERRETFVQIIYGQEGERLVTAIEVLSLTNKTPAEHGRDLYQRKQREILESKTHLVEIDLLRGGEHTTAVPRPSALKKCGRYDYHVCIHHYDNLEDYFVYPILMTERLPEIDVPLLPGDPAVRIDLQAVFDRCYDAGPYRRTARYADRSPIPPLGQDQSAWAEGLLRERGLLPPSRPN